MCDIILLLGKPTIKEMMYNVMDVTRTAHFYIKHSDLIDDLCYKSKNIYNDANYILRQEFKNSGKWIRYNKLFCLVRELESYKAIGSNVGQATLKFLDRNWKSFFAAKKVYRKRKSEFLGIPRPPKYLDYNGRFPLIIDNIKFRIIDGYIYFSWSVLKPLNNTFDVSWIHNITKLCEIRFIPMGVGYKMELVYQTEAPECDPDVNRIVGIDFGLANFVTMVNNIGEKPIIVKGGVLKSINQYYNKKRSKIQEELRTKNHKSKSRSLSKLTLKRNEKIANFMHRCSKWLVDYCVLYNVDTIIVGKNDGWKQESKMSRVVNQSFVQIPTAKFIEMLRYKCQNNGIRLIETEESYTSKASFLDNDEIPTFKEGRDATFSGKRIKRGMYQSLNGMLINADVNGAYNIVRKAVPKIFNGIEDVSLHPVQKKFVQTV